MRVSAEGGNPNRATVSAAVERPAMLMSRIVRRPSPLALIAGLIAVGIATTAPLSPASAQSPAPSTAEIPQISVTGLGEVRISPDRALAIVGVETRRQTAAQAATENARQTKAVIDAVRAAGVAADDIATADYSVTADQQYDQPTRSTRITGYIVRNSVRVRILQIENTGAVLDAALARGANTIHGVELTNSSLTVARREALANAVEQAKADAEVMARAAGGTLGPLLDLSVQESGGPVFERVAFRAMAAGADAGTPIAGGQQSVRAHVTARWRFIQGK